MKVWLKTWIVNKKKKLKMVACSEETQKYRVRFFKKRMLGGSGDLGFKRCRFVVAARVSGPVSLVAGRDFG